MKTQKDLIIPIWKLYDIESIDNIDYNKSVSESLKDFYDLKRRKNLYRALKWAEENANYQFKEIMSNTPVSGYLKFNNEEVYNYLMEFKVFMENEEFGLLTDDRPPKEL